MALAYSLHAINGPGRRGNCSYADVNTGELRVEGKNMETQSWRHRGGPNATIIVEVDCETAPLLRATAALASVARHGLS